MLSGKTNTPPRPGQRSISRSIRRIELSRLRLREGAFRARPAEGGAGLSAPGLSFTATPGPLLGVVGLCGGAGATTLAYLTAATAALQSSQPVLVCDTGGPTAGLAHCAGVHSARTLADLAERLANGEPLGGELFAEADDGLRVIAAAPQFTVRGGHDGVLRILKDARGAHALTVVDVGTLAREAEQAAITSATHVAWILPASTSAIGRATRVLSRIAPLGRPEFLIARSAQERPPMRALRALAEDRRAPLILMPHLAGLARGRPAAAISEAALTLQAIGGLLRR